MCPTRAQTAAPALDDDTALEAAYSYVFDPRGRVTAYRAALAHVSHDELEAHWARVGGFPRTLATLLALVEELASAEGRYRSLLEAALGVDPHDVAGEIAETLSACRGDLTLPAQRVADVARRVHSWYVSAGGQDAEFADLMRDRAEALQRGPLPDGGYWPVPETPDP